MWIVGMYARELPRLQSEESLHGVTVAALGAGSVKRERARSITTQWERTARGRVKPVGDPIALLGSFGFAVEVHRV